MQLKTLLAYVSSFFGFTNDPFERFLDMFHSNFCFCNSLLAILVHVNSFLNPFLSYIPYMETAKSQ